MGRKGNVPNRQYTLEYKIEAVRLAESIGGSQAAKRLEIPDSSIWNWIRLKRAGKLQAGDPAGTPVRRAPTELEAENARLRRELAEAKLDVDVLKNVWSAPEVQAHSIRWCNPFCVNVSGPVCEAHWLLALMEPARIDPHKAFGHD